MIRLASLALALLLAVPGAVLADGPMTWISYGQLQPGKSASDAVAVAMEDQEMIQGLLDEGILLSWGIAAPVNHAPDDEWNVIEWTTVADWKAIDQWVGRILQQDQQRSDEDRAARQAAFDEVYVPGSHWDEVVDHAVFEISGEPMRVLVAQDHRALPGKGGALNAMFESHGRPIVQKLLSEGTITGYGLQTPDLHDGEGWTHRFWYGLSGFGGIEEVRAAFDAAMDEESGAEWMEIIDPEAHRDKVFAVFREMMATPADAGE